MIRFTMPGPGADRQTVIRELQNQYDAFLRSEALRELLDLLGADTGTFSEMYGGRRMPDGRVIETQEMQPLLSLEREREVLYPLFKELGFFDIKTPVRSGYSRVLVLGGSVNACNVRARYAADFTEKSVVSVDGLSCYRPVSPAERSRSRFASDRDTEFGVMTEAFASAFGLAGLKWEDEFRGDRNLNGISCIRTFTGRCAPAYRIFAAPSSEPAVRRADTGDNLAFYLKHGGLTAEDTILAVTNNRYCNRQFIQLAYAMLMTGENLYLDVIGCPPDGKPVTSGDYDPFQYLQDLIGMLDWIRRFDAAAGTAGRAFF